MAKTFAKIAKTFAGLQKINSDKKSMVKVNHNQSQRSKSTLVNVLVNDDVAVTSANDVAMMTSLGLTSAKGPGRVTARGSAWKRVKNPGGAWRRVKNPGGAWRRVERVRSRAEFSGGA